MNRRFLHWRLLGFAAAVAFACASAACAGGTPYAVGANNAIPSPSPSPIGNPSPSPSPSSSPSGQNCVVAISPAGVETIGINLTSQSACVDNTFQAVKGYFGGGTITTSQVISVTHSGTNAIQFVNLDSQAHTANNLGAWTGSYPPNGPNLGNPSPKNTDISAAGWQTGLLNPGQTSRSYLANVPGMYVIGCAIHYLSDNMRTVIVVQ